MKVIVVANPKGGVGKSTLSTNVAGYLARSGHAVLLGDADRQQTCSQWLKLRPARARQIMAWDASQDDEIKIPAGATHAVLDTPAGLHGRALKETLRCTNKLLVPLQPSLFDICATSNFLEELKQRKRYAALDVGVVGMRVAPRTLAADNLRSFVASLDLPVLGYIRETQNYIHLAAHGLTLFDLKPTQVSRDLEQWAPICAWLDA